MTPTKDPWTQILNQFYDLHKTQATLLPFGKKWKVKISGFEINLYNWVDTILREWDEVEQITPDCWSFETRKHAEKFITLFNLRWAR